MVGKREKASKLFPLNCSYGLNRDFMKLLEYKNSGLVAVFNMMVSNGVNCHNKYDIIILITLTFLQALSAANLKPSCTEEVVNADFSLVIRFPSVNPKTGSRTRGRNSNNVSSGPNNGILSHASCGNHFSPRRSMFTLGKS